MNMLNAIIYYSLPWHKIAIFFPNAGTVNSPPPPSRTKWLPSADCTFKCIFMNERFCILIQILLKLVPKGPIENTLALVQVMAWRRTGDKPLPESMVTQFLNALKGDESIVLCSHYSKVTWASWHLKSPATRLLVQQFVQDNSKENIIALHYRPFVRGIHTSGFHSQRDSNAESVSMWLHQHVQHVVKRVHHACHRRTPQYIGNAAINWTM